jgi:two-component system response regulator ChvI
MALLFSPAERVYDDPVNQIAVVDDEKNIREVLRIALEKEFYRVSEYAGGLEALKGFQEEKPDLIILDILMPRMDGLELCKRIRTLAGGDEKWGRSVPILFLSSRDEEIDKVLGLESGGDDYVSKPFSLRELLARIRVSLRRLQAADGGAPPQEGAGKTARIGALLLDGERLFASWGGRPLEFTVTEFRILRCLTARPGVIKTREQLMAAAFPEDNFPNDRAADSHIKRIRRKFLEADGGFEGMEAVYGLGYRWKSGGGEVRPSAGPPAPETGGRG